MSLTRTTTGKTTRTCPAAFRTSAKRGKSWAGSLTTPFARRCRGRFPTTWPARRKTGACNESAGDFSGCAVISISGAARILAAADLERAPAGIQWRRRRRIGQEEIPEKMDDVGQLDQAVAVHIGRVHASEGY